MRLPIYHGWVVVAGLFCMLTVSSGFGFYNMSVYISVLSQAEDIAISQISIAVSLFFVVGGVAGIWAARLIEQYDVRWVIIGGAALAGVSLGLIGEVRSMWGLYLLFVLFGIGNSGVSIVISTTLVARWFPGPNRSIALSVASTGLSMGGVLLTPMSARLINDYGIQNVMPGFGAAFFLLILPIALWMLKGGPQAHRVEEANAQQVLGWSYQAALRSKFFLLLTAAFVFCMLSQVGGIAHLYNRVEGQSGYLVAATAVQILTLMSIVSRIVGGLLITRVPIRWFTLGNLSGQVLGLAIIAMADSSFVLLLGAGVFGATVGNLLMLHPLWLAEAFGIRAYSRIFSMSNAITVLGVAGGPVLLGVLYDAWDYRVAYGFAAGVSVLAGLCVLSAGATPDAGDPQIEVSTSADERKPTAPEMVKSSLDVNVGHKPA